MAHHPTCTSSQDRLLQEANVEHKCHGSFQAIDAADDTSNIQDCSSNDVITVLHAPKEEEQHLLQQGQQVEAMQLTDLPDTALERVLVELPLDQLVGPCSMACRRLHAAATSVAPRLRHLECSSSSQQAVAAIEHYMRTHGSQLEALQLEGPRPCSLPWESLHQLQMLKLSHLELSYAAQRGRVHPSRFMAGASAPAVEAAAAAPSRAALYKLTALTSLQLDSCHIMDDENGTRWLARQVQHLTCLRRLQIETLHTQFSFGAATGGHELNNALEQLTLLTSLTLTRENGALGGACTALSRLTQLQHLKLGKMGENTKPLSLISLPSSLTAVELQECIVSRLASDVSSLQLLQLQQLCISDVCPDQTPEYMYEILGIEPESPAGLTAAAVQVYASLVSPQLRRLSFAVHSEVPPEAVVGLLSRLPQLQQLTSLTLDLGSPSQQHRPHNIPAPAFSSFSVLQELYLVGLGSNSHPVDMNSLPAGLTTLAMWECTFRGSDTTIGSKLSSAANSLRRFLGGLGISSRSTSSTSCQPVLQSLLLNSLRCSDGLRAGSASLGAFLAQQTQVTCLVIDAPFLAVADTLGSHLRLALNSIRYLQQLQHLKMSWLACQLPADLWAAVTASSKLTSLQLNSRSVSANAAQHIAAGHMQMQQWLTCTDDYGNRILHSRDQFAATGCTRVVDPGDIPRLVASCPSLQHLSIVWASANISTSELQQLLQLTALTALHVAGDGWDDAAAEEVLAHMTGLCRLSITHASKLSFAGAACLTRLTNLAKLEFELCGTVDAPWAVLKRRCVELPPPPEWGKCSYASVWQELQQLCAANPAGKAALDKHALQNLQSSRQPDAEVNAEAAAVAAAATVAPQAVLEALPAAAAPHSAGRPLPYVEELPGGIIRLVIKPRTINKMSSGAATVPGLQAAFVAKCWLELKLEGMPVELQFTVDDEDSTPAAAVSQAALAESRSCWDGRQMRRRLVGADPAMRGYVGHTLVAMSNIRGTKQLVLHLQSPGATDASQQ